jgi:glycosyltransferase involved in cell wall biosynthesis
MQSALIGRGVPSDKIAVVANWAHERHAIPSGTVDLAPYDLHGRFNVAFAGNLGLAQGLDSVLDAAQLVSKEAPNVQFILLGSGVDEGRLRDRVEQEKLKNVSDISTCETDLSA